MPLSSRPGPNPVLPALLAAALVSSALLGLPACAQPLDPQRAAPVVARVLELEEELRRLRGRLEALEVERDELRARLERLESRLEERLVTLESVRPEPAPEPRPAAPVVSRGGPAPSGPAAAAPSPQPSVPPTRTSPPAAAAPGPTAPPAAGRQPSAPPAEADLAARRGYVLGTIPREALLGTEPGPAATPAAPSRPGQSAPPPPATAAPAPSQQAARTPPAESPPGGPTAAGRWAAARELLQKGDWPKAEEALRRFVEDFPNDPNAPTAAYWLGETFLVREDWQNAAATFARNYRTFGRDAPRAPDNLLKLGVALARLGDKDKACQTFAELERRHPDASQAVRQALARERVAAGCS